jgi:hypothetical protein
MIKSQDLRKIEEAIGDNHIFEDNGIRGVWGF